MRKKNSEIFAHGKRETEVAAAVILESQHGGKSKAPEKQANWLNRTINANLTAICYVPLMPKRRSV